MLCTANVHPSLLCRKIIHFDMDCFYAAVEMRDDPRLRGKPVVVGGSPNSRGVVSTASYEARQYGVRSAMPCAHAKRLCPKAIFVPPNFAKYQAASQQIRAIFAQYTALIEPLSLDEAYLDVTHNELGLYAVKIAKRIQEEILAVTQLTGSAGIAPNKMLAKIASDMNKPHGLTAVLPHQAYDFMQPLSLRKIPGIGPASEKRLNQHGFYRCADVVVHSQQVLQALLGERMGRWLYDRVRGLDERAVQPHRERKSMGKEDTFREDVIDIAQLQRKLEPIAQAIAAKLERNELVGRTITLKVKYANFKQITRSHTLTHPTRDPSQLLSSAFQLLTKTKAGVEPVRLVGLSVAKLSAATAVSSGVIASEAARTA